MELLFLLLLVPVIWLMLLPSRIAGTLRRHRYASAAIVIAVLAGGILLLQLNHKPDVPTDYARGDTALRALLE
jgi:hypothetical protein